MHRSGRKITGWALAAVLVTGVFGQAAGGSATAADRSGAKSIGPRVSKAVAFDVSAPLRKLARRERVPSGPIRLPRERGPVVADRGFSGDGAVQATARSGNVRIGGTVADFEGLSNADNPFEVSPPDPNGEVGPNHYVEMVNIVFAVYSKTGTRLLGPLTLGTLWAGFAVPDCTDLSGDPVVLYDQLEDRWILTQFTTRGPIFYNCVAVSQTGDPTGAYYRYAFSAGEFFPDYPKYSVGANSS